MILRRSWFSVTGGMWITNQQISRRWVDKLIDLLVIVQCFVECCMGMGMTVLPRLLR